MKRNLMEGKKKTKKKYKKIYNKHKKIVYQEQYIILHQH